MGDYQIRVGEGLLQVPWWWLDALLVWLALIGLVFFLLGRRLVRPAFGAIGLILGAGAMFAIATAWIAPHWPQLPPAAMAIIGGILGGLAGFLLWRLGVGVVLAFAIAIAAPAAALILTGTPGPPVEQPLAEARQQLRATFGTAGDGGDSQTPPAELPDVTPVLTGARDSLWQSAHQWWTNLPNSQRWLLGMLCIGGGLLAALIGLAAPYLSATFVTAALGAAMMLGLVYRVFDMLGDRAAAILPHNSRALLYLLLTATLIGVLLQWTVFRPARKRDD